MDARAHEFVASEAGSCRGGRAGGGDTRAAALMTTDRGGGPHSRGGCQRRHLNYVVFVAWCCVLRVLLLMTREGESEKLVVGETGFECVRVWSAAPQSCRAFQSDGRVACLRLTRGGGDPKISLPVEPGKRAKGHAGGQISTFGTFYCAKGRRPAEIKEAFFFLTRRFFGISPHPPEWRKAFAHCSARPHARSRGAGSFIPFSEPSHTPRVQPYDGGRR